ncbi:MAG: c-type cytochrome [Ilumatobacteraceae bacterium]
MSGRHLLHVGVSTLVAALLIVACRPQPVTQTQTPGGQLYAFNCATCHGAAGQGVGDFPKLIGVASILNGDYARTVITQGRNKMAAFGTKLTPAQINEIVDYIATFRK